MTRLEKLQEIPKGTEFNCPKCGNKYDFMGDVVEEMFCPGEFEEFDCEKCGRQLEVACHARYAIVVREYDEEDDE